jgi:hypothetical protein
MTIVLEEQHLNIIQDNGDNSGEVVLVFRYHGLVGDTLDLEFDTSEPMPEISNEVLNGKSQAWPNLKAWFVRQLLNDAGDGYSGKIGATYYELEGKIVVKVDMSDGTTRTVTLDASKIKEASGGTREDTWGEAEDEAPTGDGAPIPTSTITIKIQIKIDSWANPHPSGHPEDEPHGVILNLVFFRPRVAPTEIPMMI